MPFEIRRILAGQASNSKNMWMRWPKWIRKQRGKPNSGTTKPTLEVEPWNASSPPQSIWRCIMFTSHRMTWLSHDLALVLHAFNNMWTNSCVKILRKSAVRGTKEIQRSQYHHDKTQKCNGPGGTRHPTCIFSRKNCQVPKCCLCEQTFGKGSWCACLWSPREHLQHMYPLSNTIKTLNMLYMAHTSQMYPENIAEIHWDCFA